MRRGTQAPHPPTRPPPTPPTHGPGPTGAKPLRRRRRRHHHHHHPRWPRPDSLHAQGELRIPDTQDHEKIAGYKATTSPASPTRSRHRVDPARAARPPHPPPASPSPHPNSSHPPSPQIPHTLIPRGGWVAGRAGQLPHSAGAGAGAGVKRGRALTWHTPFQYSTCPPPHTHMPPDTSHTRTRARAHAHARAHTRA